MRARGWPANDIAQVGASEEHAIVDFRPGRDGQVAEVTAPRERLTSEPYGVRGYLQGEERSARPERAGGDVADAGRQTEGGELAERERRVADAFDIVVQG